VKETERRKGEREMERGESDTTAVRLCVREKERERGKGGFKMIFVRLCERETKRERKHENAESNRTHQQRLVRHRAKKCKRQRQCERIERDRGVIDTGNVCECSHAAASTLFQTRPEK